MSEAKPPLSQAGIARISASPVTITSMRDVFGPLMVDQAIRQAIQHCWMALPEEERFPDRVEQEMLRLVQRALQDMREDAAAFGYAKEGKSGWEERLARVRTQYPIHQIAAALIRQGDKVLLVRQQGADDPADSWAIPGGVVEEGELLTEALVREVHEETGLEVLQVGPLAYLAQLDDPTDGHQTIAFVFEVREWRGSMQPADPDQVVLGLEFCALPDAIKRLQALQWPAMREPIVAYLRGEVSPASVWLYRHQADPGDVLVAKLENRQAL